jgi:hypothetical protein
MDDNYTYAPTAINIDTGAPTVLSSEAREDTAFAILSGSTHARQDYGFCRTHETPDRAQKINHFRGIQGTPRCKLRGINSSNSQRNWEST